MCVGPRLWVWYCNLWRARQPSFSEWGDVHCDIWCAERRSCRGTASVSLWLLPSIFCVMIMLVLLRILICTHNRVLQEWLLKNKLLFSTGNLICLILVSLLWSTRIWWLVIFGWYDTLLCTYFATIWHYNIHTETILCSFVTNSWSYGVLVEQCSMHLSRWML